MRGWRGRAGVAVAAGVLCLGLAACDPGEDPTDPDTTTSSGETSTEPVTTESSSSGDVPTPPDLEAPVPPEAIGVDDREGAAAFAEYYFALLDYARATGDVRQLDAISSRSCEYCQTMLDTIEAMDADGGWIESPGSELQDVRVQYLEEDFDADYLVRFVLKEPEATAYLSDGTTQRIAAQSHPRFALGATWTADGFVAEGVDTDTDD